MDVRVSEISVANPESSYSQDEMLAMLGLAGDRFAETIFARCGVSRRHFELTPEVLSTTLQERTVQTEEQSPRSRCATTLASTRWWSPRRASPAS